MGKLIVLFAVVIASLGVLTLGPAIRQSVTAQNGLVVQDLPGMRCAYFPPSGPPGCVALGGTIAPLTPVPSVTPTATPIPTATPTPTPTPVPGAIPGEITAPIHGTDIGGAVTFSWTAGVGATQFWLWVSTVPGDGNVYSQSQGTNLSVTVANVPTSGAVYVRLWSLVNGAWLFNDYQYT